MRKDKYDHIHIVGQDAPKSRTTTLILIGAFALACVLLAYVLM